MNYTKLQWKERFQIYDTGYRKAGLCRGRTSELSAVCILPCALQETGITNLLSMDSATHNFISMTNVKAIAASQLPMAKLDFGNDTYSQYTPLLPYRDRLELVFEYFHQLVEQTLDQELPLDKIIVYHGLNIFRNKGSAHQRAYIRRLRAGSNDFFVTSIELLEDGQNSDFMLQDYLTSGDFLPGLDLGTRQDLAGENPAPLPIAVMGISPNTIGRVIDLFQEAAGSYALFRTITAYHPPGIKAGQETAQNLVEIQQRIMGSTSDKLNKLFTVKEILQLIHFQKDTKTVNKVIPHLTANAKYRIMKAQGRSFPDRKFGLN